MYSTVQWVTLCTAVRDAQLASSRKGGGRQESGFKRQRWDNQISKQASVTSLPSVLRVGNAMYV